MDRRSLIILKRGLRNDPVYRAPKVLSLASRRAFLQAVGSGAALAAISRTTRASVGAIRAGGWAGVGGGLTGFYPAGHWVSPVVPFGNSYLASTLIYPRPDAETATWARHRWLYYDGTNAFANRIPLITRGGSYPWVDQLISAPAAAGASLGATYWQPNWTISQALAAGYGLLTCSPMGTFSAGAFQIRRWSQDGTFVDIEFTSSTIAGYNATAGEGFVFISSTGTDPGSYPSSGTASNFSTPIQTLAWAYGAAHGDVTYPNATLVILGTGTINTFPQDATYGIAPVPNASPMAIIGQPGVTTNIDAGEPAGPTLSGTHMAFDLQNGSTDHFFDNVECTGGNQASATWRYFNAPTGQKLVRPVWNEVSFPNTWSGTGATDNAGPVILEDPGSTVSHTYVGVRGCTSSNAVSSANNSAIFETYNCQYGCAELCTATNSSASGGIGPKASTQDFTIQSCWVDSGATPHGGDHIWTGCFNDGFNTNNIEIRYCYVVGGPRALGVNAVSSTPTAALQHWIYRCSVIGGMGIYYQSGMGPLDYSASAIQYTSGSGPFMVNTGTGYVSTAVTSLPAGVSYGGSQSCIGTGSIINATTGAFQSGFTSFTGTIGAPIA